MNYLNLKGLSSYNKSVRRWTASYSHGCLNFGLPIFGAVFCHQIPIWTWINGNDFPSIISISAASCRRIEAKNTWASRILMELTKRHSWIEAKYIKVLHKRTRFPIDFFIPTDVERPFYIDIQFIISYDSCTVITRLWTRLYCSFSKICSMFYCK